MTDPICPDCKQPRLRSGYLHGRRAYTCQCQHQAVTAGATCDADIEAWNWNHPELETLEREDHPHLSPEEEALPREQWDQTNDRGGR